MNKIKSFFTNRKTVFAAAVLSGIAAAVNYAFRTSYVFTDMAVFRGFSMILLMICVLNTLALIIMYMMKANRSRYADKKAFNFAYIVCLFITAVFTVWGAVSFITAGSETSPVILRTIKAQLPFILTAFTIVFLAAAFPKINSGKAKRIISAVIIAAVFLGGILRLFPISPYKITSDPLVIDSGNTYSVVFATTDEGTGYITYSYGGRDFKIYDEDGGRINGGSKIHTVSVPKEHLNGNKYKIGSVRVIDELSYGGRLGKEVVSSEYAFSAPSGENQKFLTVSDWHTELESVYKDAEKAGKYDGLILLGDAVPGMMFEEEIIKYIIEFGGTLTEGAVPTVYVRGNHETRGPEAAKLNDYLGLDSFYYTADFGDYEFLVLDSGEDKEDSHPEYGGMVCYEQYREDMISWLKTVTVKDKTIALCHSSNICLEENLKAEAYSKLNELNINQIISGHRHRLNCFEENGLRVFVNGKHMTGTLTLSPNGYSIETYDDGETEFKKDFTW